VTKHWRPYARHDAPARANRKSTPPPKLQPFALKDAPALIEAVFPAQNISAEAQRERKADELIKPRTLAEKRGSGRQMSLPLFED
jgi:hypothetical protein